MTASAPAADPATVTLDQSPEMSVTALYRAAIGPINTDHYLPLFERFEAAGKPSLSWNTSAALYHLNWMLFRGMWGVALGYAALVLVAGLLLWALASPLSWLIGLALALAIPGLWGNALFFNHCRKTLMAAVEANPTFKTACDQLVAHASSRQRFVRILLGNALVLAAAAVAWLMTAGDGALTDATVRGAQPAASASAHVASVPIPAASAASAVAATATVSASVPEAAASVALTASATEKPASAPLPAASENTVAAAAAPAQSQPAASSPAPQAFYVNAGLFANADNARNVLNKLQQAGLPVFAQVLEMPNGTRTRVRVGPFAKRSQAQAAVVKIRALKLEATLANAK